MDPMNFLLAPHALTVGAAQTLVWPGDVAANVQQHLLFVEAAAAAGVQLLVFPELSLMGYELSLLASNVLAPDAALIAPLRQAAAQHGMVLVVGAAVAGVAAAVPASVPAPAGAAGGAAGLPAIGSLVLHPDGRTEVYRKHHLHEGEQHYASPGAAAAHVTPLASESVGLAVCADITHPEHAQAAHAGGASLYACSMLLSKNGYPAESAMLQGYARTHGMAVLMANYGAPTGGYLSAGRSALWAPGGDVVVAAPGVGACLVVGRRSPAAGAEQAVWTGSVLSVQGLAP